uniref:Fatty-acid amide hydrolase n=1 Tax=Colletotrichum fructicola (strain Nara gc5) TaxID=1213859 RepID=L2FRK7_COLFN
MPSQSHEAPWVPIARRKQAERAARIPAKWHIPASVIPRDPPHLRDGPQNVLSVPRQFLSGLEISITEGYTIERLVKAISSRAFTAVQVAEAFCHRAAFAQQLTNCLTEPLFDAALERAAFLDRYLSDNGKPIGPLHGLPVSVKDTFNVTGVDSSMGLASLCHKPATENAPLVNLLLSLGCVIIAKTNIPQTLASLDSVNNVFGRTMNPINRLCTAGGSSGGEGVLVAMKGSMIGIGTDIGGPGATAFTGSSHLTGACRTAGKSVEDIDTLLREIMPRASSWGEDCMPTPWSPTPRSMKASGSGKNGELVIGVLRGDGNCVIHPPIANVLDEVAASLAHTANIKVVPLHIPKALTVAQSVMNKLMGVDGSVPMLDMIEATGEPLVPWTAARIKRGQPQPLTRVAEIQAQRSQIEREMLKIWVEDDEYGRRTQRVDAIVCPLAPHPVPPIEGYNAVGLTSSWVLLDYPAGTVPVRNVEESDLELGKPQDGKAISSWDERNRELWDETKIDRRLYLGTPLSVQIVVPRLQDEKLVEVMGLVDAACKGYTGRLKLKL